MDGNWGDYGLVGLILLVVFTAIGWVGKRLFGAEGLMEKGITAVHATAAAFDKNADATEKVGQMVANGNACCEANAEVSQRSAKQTDQLHRAAKLALEKIEARYADSPEVHDDCQLIRRVLEE